MTPRYIYCKPEKWSLHSAPGSYTCKVIQPGEWKLILGPEQCEITSDKQAKFITWGFIRAFPDWTWGFGTSLGILTVFDPVSSSFIPAASVLPEVRS